MRIPGKYIVIVALVLGIGISLRLVEPGKRPMHNDEAVNAVKFGQLLQNGIFTYDKEEYHGPLLYYLTLLPAWMDGIATLQDMQEKHIRYVAAFTGIGLMVLVVGLSGIMGRRSVILIVTVAALSPAMVFYSRYYIHEMVLVLLTYGFVFSVILFLKHKSLIWLLASGALLGLMHATKETFVLSVGALLLALVVYGKIWGRVSLYELDKNIEIPWYQYLIAAGAALLISVTFYSSFFNQSEGIVDSITAYANYFERAGGNELHQHPFWYYMGILAWNDGPGFLVWTELPVMILALTGVIMVCRRQQIDEKVTFFRIIALFTVSLAIIYAFIPYKTPWNMLTFYFGMIMMAGYGTDELLRRLRKVWFRSIITALLLFSAGYLLLQVLLFVYRYPADPSNPYAYAHTSMDVYRMMNSVREVAESHPEGHNIYVQVISPGHDYWPLPWYLRSFENVGYWDHVDADTPLAPLIIAAPELESALIRKMYKVPEPGEKYLYIPLFEEGTELRPGKTLKGYLRQDYRLF